LNAAVPKKAAQIARFALLGIWLLVALVHLSLPPDQRVQIWPLAYMLLEILATTSLAYRSWRTQGHERLAWGLLAVSAGLEIPNLALLFLDVHGNLSAWAAPLPHFMTLATGVLVLVGILTFPRRKERNWGVWRRALDGLIFAASILFLLWVMGVQSALHSGAPGVAFRVFVAYLNAALLGGGLVFLTSYNPNRILGPFGWLGASALAWLGALSCWTLAGLPADPGSRGWILLAGCIPLFQGLAAWSYLPHESSHTAENRGKRFGRLLPYLPVSAALVVLAVLLPSAPLDLMRGAFGIFLALVVLLLLRQFQAILDLQAARRTLEERVQQRTNALEQAQDTLLRTERMNTLALMGAGLAHDLNNLLCAVKGSAELAAMNLEDGLPPVPADLTRIATTAERASVLTSRLMGFARQEAEELTAMDLGRELQEIETTLRFILPRSVQLRIEVAAGEALLVRSSRLRLEQMLVNLVANARDAMPAGGTLTIRTQAAGVPAADSALVEVLDTGTGMSAETVARIFEPFFTTKAPGKGTGLGLSSLKALVEEGGGSLVVESEIGKGSRFRILLPRVAV
jgi:signal transduction histidine kinase